MKGHPLGERVDWTPELEDRLTALHAAGMSYAEIGRQIGVSKNAVVGKAHRLQLPKRPCPVPTPGRRVPVLRGAAELRAAQEKQAALPQRNHGVRALHARGAAALVRAQANSIRPAEGFRTRGSEAAGGVLLSAGRHHIPAPVAGDPTAGGSCGAAGAACVPSLHLPPPAPASAGVFSGGVPERGCSWPMWANEERATHRYCAEPQAVRADGTRCPYCLEHAAVAFRPYDPVPTPSVVSRRTFAWGGSAA